jgi:hypothetical protein
VKIRFQNLPFKCNLQRYAEVDEATIVELEGMGFGRNRAVRALYATVGLCRLNQVDP